MATDIFPQSLRTNADRHFGSLERILNLWINELRRGRSYVFSDILQPYQFRIIQDEYETKFAMR